jgi:tRNA-splicing ligase RtcB
MNAPSHPPTVARWLAGPLPKDVAQSLDRLAAAEDVRHIAILPDVHLSGDVCVGVALATRRLIYPAAVGGDIGCGMAAVAVNAPADILDKAIAGQLLTELPRYVPSMRHSRATMPSALPSNLLETPLSDPRLMKLVDRDGRVQFGTLGRGNHFLELQADQENRLWLMLHSGSRAMGQAITAHHVARAEQISQRRRLPYLDIETTACAAYLADVAWAIRYAEQSRLAMLRATEELLLRMLGVTLDWKTLIHSNHNHVRKEMHGSETLLVHRKGALPAAEDEPGVIPGSMGSPSFHVAGRGCPESLCSSSHGAGRALSRKEAAQRLSPRGLQREMHGVWFDDRQTRHLLDEAPSAYKDIRAVMRAQRDLTRIERELRPLLSYKGL